MKVLDSDTCIYLLRGNELVLARLAGERGEVSTTWITAAELYFGAAHSKAPRQNAKLVDAFLETLPVLGLDGLSARIFGEAKSLLERRGLRVPDADLLIGAIVAARQATVVTANVRHYARIPGVSVEDWTRPPTP